MAFSVDIDSIAPAPRLTSRRGSLSAPDPFARNASLDTPRGLTSRLTIVRIPAPPECPSGEDAVVLQKSRVRAHTSAGSYAGRSAGWGQPRTGPDTPDGRKERMSFALTSFFPAKSSDTDDSSPSSSPPRSPFRSPFAAKDRTHSSPSFSAFQTRRPSLSPDQVCDLARSTIAQAAHDGTSDPASPRAESSSPLAPFTPLPESHYLPFIDRPSEVRALLSSDGNKRFMALLKQTFPSHLRDAAPGNNADAHNPTEWSFPALSHFLFACPRSAAPDRVWVPRVRQCIRARSEAVWERFKNVLGVPPELDVDEEGEEDEEEEDEEDELDDAWVEPVFPSRVTSASPVDVGEDAGYGFRGGMATIGEGEEEETVLTVTPASPRPASPAPAPIRALLLCTRTSFSEGALPPSDKPRARSLSHEHTPRPEFERGPGNPLFPSNFGRLSIGPTLAANNPLPSAYTMPRRHTHAGAEAVRPLRRWGSECAVTFASGSSDRGSAASDHEGGQAHR